MDDFTFTAEVDTPNTRHMMDRYVLPGLLSALVLITGSASAQTRAARAKHPVPRSASVHPGTHARSVMALGSGTAERQARKSDLPTSAAFDRGGPPANDDCAGATTLTVSAAFTPIDGDVFGATQSIAAITCATFVGTADDDVWYKFVATTSNPKVRVVGNQYFDAVVDLRSGACNGTNIACADATLEGEAEQINASGLTIGSTYYVRVYSYYDTLPPVTTFSIGVYTGALTAPANDQCGSVVPQSLSAGGSLTFNGNTAAATTTNDYAVGSAWEGTILPSTWHAFTTTTCTNVTISYCGTNPAFEDIWIALNTGCPADDAYILASGYDFTSCGDGNVTMLFQNLPAGTYYLPVMAEGGNALGPYTIQVDATGCSAAPSNDECSSVTFTPLSAGSTITFTGNSTGATVTGDYAAGTALDGSGPSVWHGFSTSTCVDLVVSYCGIAPTWNNAWVVLATSCPADDNLIFNTSFNTTDCPDGNITIYYTGLPAGDYYFPVLNDPLNGADGPYSIDLTATACAGGGPANDDCGSVSFTPLSTGSTITFTGDNTGATDAGDYVIGSTLDQGLGSVWHGFTTTTCANVVVSYCGITPTWNNAWIVLATSCPADDNLIFSTSWNITDCPDGNITIFYNNLPAGTYYLPVMNDPANDAVGPYSIDVSATACVGPPANDDCAGAIAVDVELPADCPSNAVTGDNTDGTPDGPFNVCDPTGTLIDLWYTFNSLANTEVTIDLAPISATDWAFVVFDACGGTEVFCYVAPAGPQVVPVTPGTDYVVQVYSNTDFGVPGTFSLCISGNFSSNVIEPLAQDWNVYPNPSNGDITLAYGGAADDVTIELFDVTGRSVHMDRRRLTAGSTVAIHLAGQVAQGTYTMRLTGSSGSSEQRVVVR